MVQRPWHSAQTLLLLTDAPWQQENFALVFHAHKMPVGLTLQELCTNAVSWESSVGLRTFFPSLHQNFKSLKNKKKKKRKPQEKQISMRHAHPNLSSLQACTAVAYPAIQISNSDLHLLTTQTAVMMWSIQWTYPGEPHIPLYCSSSVTSGDSLTSLTVCFLLSSSFSLGDCPTTGILNQFCSAIRHPGWLPLL